MSQSGFVIVWVTPMFNQTFVWNPGRTLAFESIHGDAPQTNLTGSGRPNPDRQSRTIDGVPGLMVMGEYECWEDRLKHAFDYVVKKSQQLGFRQNGRLLKPTKGHANYQLPFIPGADGISFHLSSVFTDTSRVRATAMYARTPIRIDRICGPVRKLNYTIFQLGFNRMALDNPRRSNDIWLPASNGGDTKYKSMVQQADLRFPITNKDGKLQTITFPGISTQQTGTKSLLPGGVSSKVQSAIPVEQTFFIQSL